MGYLWGVQMVTKLVIETVQKMAIEKAEMKVIELVMEDLKAEKLAVVKVVEMVASKAAKKDSKVLKKGTMSVDGMVE